MLKKKLAPSCCVLHFPKRPAIILGDLLHLLTPLLLRRVVTAPSHPIQPPQGPLQEKQNMYDLKEFQGEVNGEQLGIAGHKSHQGILALDQQLTELPLELALQECMQGLGLCKPTRLLTSGMLDPRKFEEALVGKWKIYKKSSNLGWRMMTKQNESPNRTISLPSPCWAMEEDRS